MDAIMDMAKGAGMDQSQGEAATGGILSLLKQKLDGDQFNQILSNVPGAEKLMTEQEANRDEAGSSGGGMGGMLGSAMSSFTSGGSGSGAAPTDMTGLLASLSSKGVDPGMMSKFIPQLGTFFKEKCGVDASSVLGGPSGDSSSDPMGSLSGMASSFLK